LRGRLPGAYAGGHEIPPQVITVIEEQATVVATSAGAAVLQATRRSSCGSCGAAAGCGTSLLDRFLGRRPLLLEVDNSLDVAVGDRVVVGVPEASMLRAAAAAYLGPLAGLILGAIVGRHAPLGWLLPGATAGPEWLSLMGGGLGFVIALLLVARYSRSLNRDPRFRPVLLRREAPVAVSLSWG
jgi:sigma-E factor negative regulatory protein RseC